MATATLAQFESGHADTVHDAEFDYYGKRLATCSSDRMIKIFDVVGEQVIHIADLSGHEGPVFEVAWSHPKFGSLLASCSYDNRIIIWKEVSDNVWQQIYQSISHRASVNSLAWAPYELGLCLAAVSSDGNLSVLTYQPDGTWATQLIENAHPVGGNSITWAPAVPKGSLVSASPPGAPVKRLASGGSDNTIKVWKYDDNMHTWVMDGPALVGHSDWVRDAAWVPHLGLPMNTIVSAGQDGRLIAWTEREDGSAWDPVVIHEFTVPVMRVSWSTTGTMVAATDAQGSTTLWTEVADGQWQLVSE